MSAISTYSWTVVDTSNDDDDVDVDVDVDGTSKGTSEVTVSIEAQKSKDCFSEEQPCTGHAIWFAAHNLSNLIAERHAQWKNANRTLELGSGPGLSGILHAKLVLSSKQILSKKTSKEETTTPARVPAPAPTVIVLTDGDEEVVDLLKRNCERNDLFADQSKVDVKAQQLWWGETSAKNMLEQYSNYAGEEHKNGDDDNTTAADVGFDVILGADLVYGKHKHNLELVVELFRTVQILLSPSEHAIFYLAFTRRDLPIEYVLETATKHGLEWTLEEDYVYDIFESNTDGQTCFWRDAIYSFRRRRRGGGGQQNEGDDVEELMMSKS